MISKHVSSPTTQSSVAAPRLQHLVNAITPYTSWDIWKQHPLCVLDPLEVATVEQYLATSSLQQTAAHIDKDAEATQLVIQLSTLKLGNNHALAEYQQVQHLLHRPLSEWLPTAQQVVLNRSFSLLPTCFQIGSINGFAGPVNPPKSLLELLQANSLPQYISRTAMSTHATQQIRVWLRQFELESQLLDAA